MFMQGFISLHVVKANFLVFVFWIHCAFTANYVVFVGKRINLFIFLVCLYLCNVITVLLMNCIFKAFLDVWKFWQSYIFISFPTIEYYHAKWLLTYARLINN